MLSSLSELRHRLYVQVLEDAQHECEITGKWMGTHGRDKGLGSGSTSHHLHETVTGENATPLCTMRQQFDAAPARWRKLSFARMCYKV